VQELRLMANRIQSMLGIEIPIVQAPMGYIARAQLASAVSNAGAMGIIETSSGRLDEVRVEIEKMADLTDKPFGVNVAQLFVRQPGIVEFVADQGVRFVTTSAGNPDQYTAALHEAGITVFHVVGNLRGAIKAAAAGVDGLIVEGVEGGGFKGVTNASTMVLLPLIASKLDLPLIAAGGIVDAPSLAATFVLGAEGGQMGTAMLASLESPVHQNWKDAVLAASETETLLVKRGPAPAMRVLRTNAASALMEVESAEDATAALGRLHQLYFGGDMEASLANTGQVAGRIESIRPVAEIIHEAWEGCQAALDAARDRLG
jgi:enoyl-[acyl-carrier protein] reductase II